jgi:death on curing protein
VKKTPRWLKLETILAMHDALLAEFGGAAGVRDRGLLESALARPEQLWHYEKKDLFELAAAYASGIIGNHPFIDGNKRTGFMAAFVFLGDNGQHLRADEPQVVLMTAGLAAKSVSVDEYASWLRANCQRSP